MTVVTKTVTSPIGEVIQVYDGETTMYLGHIVVDETDGSYVCHHIDVINHVEPMWRTHSYREAVAYVACDD